MFVQQNGAEYGANTGRIALGGWSLGSKAAMAAATGPSALDGLRPRAVVCIAGGYTGPEPLTGRDPIDELTSAEESLPAIPVWLIRSPMSDSHAAHAVRAGKQPAHLSSPAPPTSRLTPAKRSAGRPEHGPYSGPDRPWPGVA